MEKLINLKYLFLIILLTSNLVFGQDSAYIKGKEYVINDIVVTGIKSFNEQTVITYTGLFVGKKVQIPGEDISKIINTPIGTVKSRINRARLKLQKLLTINGERLI